MRNIKQGLEPRFMDLARASLRVGEPRFTRFLEPPDIALAAHAANEAGVLYKAFGGYPDAERRVVGYSADGGIGLDQWPISCLKLVWNPKYGDIGHRDLLGSVMAQGIERACVGDIAMGEGCAYLFALPEISRFLIDNLDGAGSARLAVREVGLSEARPAPPAGSSVRVTVASMRLDAVLSEGLRLGRAEAQNLIARGLVKLNHVGQFKADAKVAQGDLISARGYGRMRVERELGETRKGRIGVVLFRIGNR